MTVPTCIICTPSLCVHGGQSPDATDLQLSSLLDKVRILKSENDRLQVELARALGTIQRMSR